MMEASIWGRGSTPNGLWTVMKASPAGAMSVAPVQENTPPVESTIDDTSSVSRSTRQKVSTKSAVPDGLLMALDESFGMRRPSDATMDTTIGVILFPGTPPKLWKSKTLLSPKSRHLPVEAMTLA